MKPMKEIKVVTPAYLYLVLSVISIVAMMFQNAGNTNSYCVGNYECEVPNGCGVPWQAIYIAIWTLY